MKDDIWAHICSPVTLKTAWDKVAANGGAAGIDGVTIGKFRRQAGKHIEMLSTALREGHYRSDEFRTVHVDKPSGGTRRLMIPTVRDRIVHTAIAQRLVPILEPQFEDSSFAYRPGFSVQQAVARIEHLRQQGYRHVVEADIVSYFDNIDQTRLIEKLTKALVNVPNAKSLIEFIEQILLHQGLALGDADIGLVQGSPLSPILANLYLDMLDEEFTKKNVKIIRFADDFVLLCKSEKSAHQALEDVRTLLNQHGLRLHTGKTGISSFEDGFEFLGHLFVKNMALRTKRKQAAPKNMPSANIPAETAPQEKPPNIERFDPGPRVLHALSTDRRLSVAGQSIAILNGQGDEVALVHPNHVKRVEIGPDIAFDDQFLRHILSYDIEAALVDRVGQTLGYFSAGTGAKAKRQYSQAAFCMEDRLAIMVARRLVYSRIYNARIQLFRLNRRRKLKSVISALLALRRNLRKLPNVETIEALRGLEGASAAIYWPALGALAREDEGVYKRGRPARNPLDACLNFMAYLLERDIRAAIQSAGLHEGFGTLHAVGDGREALVYDLMEPFRAPLAEGPVVFLMRANRLRSDMFYEGEDMYRLSNEACRALVTGYEAALARRVQATRHRTKLSWRNVMRRQALDLAHAFEQRDPNLFQPQLLSS